MEWRFGVALCSFQLNCLTKVGRPGNQTADAFGYWSQAGKTVPERLHSILCVSKTLKDKEEVCRAAPQGQEGFGPVQSLEQACLVSLGVEMSSRESDIRSCPLTLLFLTCLTTAGPLGADDKKSHPSVWFNLLVSHG
uniref:Uncharacterized protein n=1 Tax=Molossus molossus TaxID=27622 RepID=A0A7J8J0Q4_MOLMO|nr:hypothetical protein HJG59_010310 [Molossus molossus]